MKTEITFAQVAHLYLRSELKMQFETATGYDSPTSLTIYHPNDWVLKKMRPIFTPFENLIKPAKANKFVAELLEINEGDEYVMAEKLYLLDFPKRRNINDLSFEVAMVKSLDGVIPLSIRYDDGYEFGTLLNFNYIYKHQALLIAAGYNVFNIKDCKYEC